MSQRAVYAYRDLWNEVRISRIKNKESRNIEPRELRTESRESRIGDRGSRIENRESRSGKRGSRIVDRGSRIENREWRIENRESGIEKRGSRIENRERGLLSRVGKIDKNDRQVQNKVEIVIFKYFLLFPNNFVSFLRKLNTTNFKASWKESLQPCVIVLFLKHRKFVNLQ